MYAKGKCTGANEFLGAIKETALKGGWELISDESVKLDCVPPDLEGFAMDDVDNGANLFDQKATTIGGECFITLPRAAGLKSVSFGAIEPNSGSIVTDPLTKKVLSDTRNYSNISIWGVDERSVEHEIIASSKTGAELNSREFLRYHVKGYRCSGVNLSFKSELIRAREIKLFSAGSSKKAAIYMSFRFFLGLDGRANVLISINGGVSGVLGLWDGEIEYLIAANENRIILGARIQDLNDALEKNPVFQMIYAGNLRLWGGEWRVGDVLCVCAPSFDKNYRWQEGKFSDFTRPWIFYGGKWQKILAKNERGDGVLRCDPVEWNGENMNIAPYPNGELFCAPCLIYIDYGSDNEDNTILGELGGMSRVVSISRTNAFDDAQIDGEDCALFLNAKNGFYAINKD